MQHVCPIWNVVCELGYDISYMSHEGASAANYDALASCSDMHGGCPPESLINMSRRMLQVTYMYSHCQLERFELLV